MHVKNCIALVQNTAFYLKLILCLMVLATSCAKVKPDPFLKFNTAMDTGQKAIQLTMGSVLKIENDYLADDFSSKKKDDLRKYKIDMDKEHDYALSSQAYFSTSLMMITNLNEKMSLMNAALKQYSDLLYAIAAMATLDDSQVKKVQADLNSAMTTAIKALDKEGQTANTQFNSDLSFMFAKLFQGMANATQRTILIKAIRENQPAFQQYADVCIQYARIYMVAHYDHAYSPKFDQLTEKIGQIDDSKAPKKANSDPKEQRQAMVTSLVELNSQLYNAKVLTNSLMAFYKQLPEVHKKLGDNLEKGLYDMENIQEMMDIAQQIYAIYTSMTAKTTTSVSSSTN